MQENDKERCPKLLERMNETAAVAWQGQWLVLAASIMTDAFITRGTFEELLVQQLVQNLLIL